MPLVQQSNPLPRPRPVEADQTGSAEPHASAGDAPANPVKPAGSHSDPVADLINANRRVAAVQRTLTEYGYGQLKPTGTAGTETQAAIRKFEQARRMPVTGQMSDRLVRELVALTGRPID
jgi:peptidoglycan hydrolase-like protein with peptidoglycan-binding domain